VSNNTVILALENCHLIRLNLLHPEELEGTYSSLYHISILKAFLMRLSDIDIARKSDDQIYKIFLDPTGSHLIISLGKVCRAVTS
jgi:hypothetical protein